MIRYFERQDYLQRELIIVDDGGGGAQEGGDQLPCDPQVRYLHVKRRMNIGAKPNLACEAARGTVIAHWGDDDWYGPTRFSARIARLLSGEAVITALDHTTFLLRAKLAVCLGSGGGFVPRLTRQAQRDLGIATHGRTILVVANRPEAGWGAPARLRQRRFSVKPMRMLKLCCRRVSRRYKRCLHRNV